MLCVENDGPMLLHHFAAVHLLRLGCSSSILCTGLKRVRTVKSGRGSHEEHELLTPRFLMFPILSTMHLTSFLLIIQSDDD